MPKETNTVTCKKADPSKVFSRGEVYAIVGRDVNTWMPTVDEPTEDSQGEVGVVLHSSAKNVDTVVMKFSGIVMVKVFTFLNSPTPGSNIGSLANTPLAQVGSTGLGVILRDLDESPIISLVLVKLTGTGEAIVRWKQFDP